MGSTGVLTRDGLVDPDAFLPGSKHLRPVAVGVSAGHLRSLGSKVASRTEAVASLWTGLGGCYQAPEGEKVLSLMSPAATAGQDMATATDRAASALEAYADELVPIRRDMIDLEGRARAFRDRVAGGVKTSVVGEHPDGFWLVAPGLKVAEAVTSDWRTVPWYEHGPSITENNGLVAEYDALLLRVQRAVDTCAEAVNRVAYTVLRARSAVYSAGALFSGPAEPPAWGYAREEDRNLLEQAYHGVWADAVGGMISGGAMLFGRDPVTGKWGSGDAARQAWGGLGDLLGSLVVVANPVVAPLAVAGAVQDRTGWDLPGGPVTDWAGDRLKVVTDAGGSLIGYDPAAADAGGDGWHLWKDEPARALASSAVNVGTFLVPVAGGVGAGAKGAAAGAKVAGGARVAAEMVLPGGSWLVRGAELAAQGGGALARTGQWSAAVETVRAASGGGRAGLGGVTNGIAQALTDLDKATPPVHRLPDSMPSVSQSVRPFDAEGLPRPGLDDATVRQGLDSWLYQDAPVEPSAAERAAGAQAPERELVSVAAERTDQARSSTAGVSPASTPRELTKEPSSSGGLGHASPGRDIPDGGGQSDTPAGGHGGSGAPGGAVRGESTSGTGPSGLVPDSPDAPVSHPADAVTTQPITGLPRSPQGSTAPTVPGADGIPTGAGRGGMRDQGLSTGGVVPDASPTGGSNTAESSRYEEVPGGEEHAHAWNEGNGSEGPRDGDGRYVHPGDQAEARFSQLVGESGADNPGGWIGAGNPHYVTGLDMWTNNCGPCSRSFADTYHGKSAIPALGDSKVPPGEYQEMWEAVGVQPASRLTNGDSDSRAFSASAYRALEESLQREGPGSVAIVGVDWDIPGLPRGKAGGHWFNAFVDRGGTVRWADEQIGRASGWPPNYRTDVWQVEAVVRSSAQSEWKELVL